MTTSDEGATKLTWGGLEITVVLLSVLWIGALLLASTSFGYGRDQATFSYVAQVILDGGMPYRDAWDVKPPGIYLTYALGHALFGPALTSIRYVEVAAMLAFLGLCCAWTRSWWHDWRIGLLGAAATVTLHGQLEFWHTAQAETFGGICVFAAAFVVRDRATLVRLLVSGLLLGAAALYKPTMVVPGGVIWIWKVLETTPRRSPGALLATGLKTALPMGVGAIVPVALCLSWFAQKQAFDDLLEVFVTYNRSHLQSNWSDYNLVDGLFKSFSDWLVLFSSVTLFGVAVLVFRRPFDRRLLPPLAIVAGLLVTVAMQAKFYWYHYDSTFFFNGLILGVAFWELLQRAKSRPALGRAAAVAYVVAAFGVHGFQPMDMRGSAWVRLAARLRDAVVGISQAERDELDSRYITMSMASVNTAHIRIVAQELEKVVPPDRTIYVFGNEPMIYLLANRRSPTRFFFNSPVRFQATAGAAKVELMNALEARPPAAIVVLSRDAVPLDFFNDKDSEKELAEFPELTKFINDGYKPYGRASYMLVYVEKGLAATTESSARP